MKFSHAILRLHCSLQKYIASHPFRLLVSLISCDLGSTRLKFDETRDEQPIPVQLDACRHYGRDKSMKDAYFRPSSVSVTAAYDYYAERPYKAYGCLSLGLRVFQLDMDRCWPST